jgi:hypothetical protein
VHCGCWWRGRWNLARMSWTVPVQVSSPCRAMGCVGVCSTYS